MGTVIDPTALAVHVLKTGFDIKDPERFLMQGQPVPPQEGAAGPPLTQGPSDMVPSPPGAPVGASPDGAFAPTGGVPPELLTQLQNQMGLDLPAL